MGFWNGFFNRMPYTNLQSINLDWMLKKLAEIPDHITTEVNRLSQELRETINDKLSRDGSDSMTGSLDMGGNRIYDLGAPQYPGDAITKAYGDGAYAPTGYGLGVAPSPNKVSNLEQLNAETANGWFRFASSAGIELGGKNYTDGWGNSRNYNNNYSIQDIFPLSPQHLEMKRWNYAGVWVDEWVNPPLALNVEYRTTMRYGGSPVFVKHMRYTPDTDIGNAEGIATVRFDHGIENFSKLVFCLGRIPANNYQFPYLTTTGGLTAIPGVSERQVTMRLDHNTWDAGTTFEFDIFYTKV